jgi:hypothetical protein
MSISVQICLGTLVPNGTSDVRLSFVPCLSSGLVVLTGISLFWCHSASLLVYAWVLDSTSPFWLVACCIANLICWFCALLIIACCLISGWAVLALLPVALLCLAPFVPWCCLTLEYRTKFCDGLLYWYLWCYWLWLIYWNIHTLMPLAFSLVFWFLCYVTSYTGTTLILSYVVGWLIWIYFSDLSCALLFSAMLLFPCVCCLICYALGVDVSVDRIMSFLWLCLGSYCPSWLGR